MLVRRSLAGGRVTESGMVGNRRREAKHSSSLLNNRGGPIMLGVGIEPTRGVSPSGF